MAEEQGRQRLKDEVFEAYGGYKCACCGEPIREFLTIDHVNGDGAAHRRKIGSAAIYRWLKREGFPDGYQVLCMNCNWAKGVFGACPHERTNGRATS